MKSKVAQVKQEHKSFTLRFSDLEIGDFFVFQKFDACGVCRKVDGYYRQNQDGNVCNTDTTANVIRVNVTIRWSES